jgi:decaprenylphospho-beta-D-ribofuranose 2-oxidase
MVTTPRSVERPLAGWGRFPVEVCSVFRPEREAELAEIVASGRAPSLVSRGMGRSYGDAALNAGSGVILHERFDRFLSFDDEAGVVSCEAAVTLADLVDVLLPRGFFLPVTPGTKHISVGGAIAADVHGKNHHRDGTISAQVLDFRLLTGSGRVLTCSREENADLFWATFGGMGLTGVVLDARLRMRPVETGYVQQQTLRCADLDRVVEHVLGEDHRYEYAVAWIDCLARGRALGRSVLLRANPAPLDALPPADRAHPHRAGRPLPIGVPFSLPQIVLNRLSMRAFNEAFWQLHRNREHLAPFERYFYPLDSVGHWNRIYGRRGVLQYQLVLPKETCRDGLREVLERVTRGGRASFLAVLKGTGPANRAPLSFPVEGASLALDFPNRGSEILGLLDELDRIVLARGGRVYLAKDARLPADRFREMYPALDHFREVKAKHDPAARFSSSLARRLGIVEGG